MTWTVRLTSFADGEQGRILETATYRTPDAALAAYRALLARGEFEGQPLAAVFKPPRDLVQPGNSSTWFSRFDREIGAGRIDPDDQRLDPWTPRAEAERIALTPPERQAVPDPHDWETDPRPLGECLKSWHRARGLTRDQAAAELGVPLSTYNGWCLGRPAERELTIRRLMTLLGLVVSRHTRPARR